MFYITLCMLLHVCTVFFELFLALNIGDGDSLLFAISSLFPPSCTSWVKHKMNLLWPTPHIIWDVILGIYRKCKDQDKMAGSNVLELRGPGGGKSRRREVVAVILNCCGTC